MKCKSSNVRSVKQSYGRCEDDEKQVATLGHQGLIETDSDVDPGDERVTVDLEKLTAFFR